MELLVYTRLFREKFQKERFLCENDLLLAVLEGAFEVQGEGGTFLVEANQAFHFFKNQTYERRVHSPLTIALFRYQSENPIFVLFISIKIHPSSITFSRVNDK